VAVVQYTFTHKQYIEQHNLFGKSVDERMSIEHWWIDADRGETVYVPLSPPQIPHGRAWD